jgi:hypothetical protein
MREAMNSRVGKTEPIRAQSNAAIAGPNSGRALDQSRDEQVDMGLYRPGRIAWCFMPNVSTAMPRFIRNPVAIVSP